MMEEKPSWLDCTIKREKRVVRRKEHIWKRINDQKSWKEFVYQRKYFCQIVCGKVRKYHHESCKNNYKETYKYANRLLFRKKETPLPSGKIQLLLITLTSFS